jgi:hypothetical protein
MAKSNVYSETILILKAGSIYPYEFFPYRMQDIEVFNIGTSDVIVMVDDASLANGITIDTNGKRDFHSNGPNFKRISFYSIRGTKIRMVVSR